MARKSGWFGGPTFEMWFFDVALPILRKLDGKKLLLGDNLASHISPSVIKACKKHNIQFFFSCASLLTARTSSSPWMWVCSSP